MTRQLLRRALIVVVLIAALGPPVPAYAATFVVISPVDGADPIPGDGACSMTYIGSPIPTTPVGDCTLRAAIQEVNAYPGPHHIKFALGVPGSVQTIGLAGELPGIVYGVTIDGWSQGGFGYTGPPLIELNGAGAGAGARGLFLVGDNSTVRGLTINRFGGPAIETLGANATIEGNYLGTDPGGAVARANGVGVKIGGNNARVGGTTASVRNVVSGNTVSGIHVMRLGGNNVIQGNFIGTNVSGTAGLGNGIGMEIWGWGNTIGGTATGAGNVIAYNTAAGIEMPLAGSGTWHNAILSNSIHSNGALGIDLATTDEGRGDGVTPNDSLDWDVGSNMLQNYPVLTSAISGANGTVSGTLNTEPNKAYRIELFVNAGCDASGHGEGQTFIGGGNVTTDGDGNVTFTATVGALTAGQVVTVTATDAAKNDTSEFSACRVVTPPAPPGVTVTPTSGLTTTEAGGTATFTVVLQVAPTANVTIGLSSSDTTEGTVSPATLTFTPANWHVAQTVTVTGLDDAIADGNVGYTIVTAPAQSADPAYNGINPADVGVTNTDNDQAPPPAACSPRPPVKLVAVPEGGRPRVTITAGSGQLRELRFPNDPKVPNWNALVFLTEGQINGDVVVLPPGRSQTVIYVQRQVNGQSATVPFRVVDDCGEWPTFVGGGPGAF